MKVGLVQYIQSLKIDSEEKSILLKAILDRDDWEITSGVYEVFERGRVIDIRTRDKKFYINEVPLGYFTKEDLINYIEELQKEIFRLKTER